MYIYICNRQTSNSFFFGLYIPCACVCVCVCVCVGRVLKGRKK